MVVKSCLHQGSLNTQTEIMVIFLSYMSQAKSDDWSPHLNWQPKESRTRQSCGARLISLHLLTLTAAQPYMGKKDIWLNVKSLQSITFSAPLLHWQNMGLSKLKSLQRKIYRIFQVHETLKVEEGSTNKNKPTSRWDDRLWLHYFSSVFVIRMEGERGRSWAKEDQFIEEQGEMGRMTKWGEERVSFSPHRDLTSLAL